MGAKKSRKALTLPNAFRPGSKVFKEFSPILWRISTVLEHNRNQYLILYKQILRDAYTMYYRMPQDIRLRFEMAVKNVALEGWDEATQVSAPYDGETVIPRLREMFNTIYLTRQRLGIPVREIQNFFPRHVNDVVGLTKHIMSERMSPAYKENILNRLERFSNEVRAQYNRDPTDEERVEFLLRSYNNDGVYEFKTAPPVVGSSNAKKRVIERVDEDINKFYANSMEALTRYVYSNITDLTVAEFFLKDGAPVEFLRGDRKKTTRHRHRVPEQLHHS